MTIVGSNSLGVELTVDQLAAIIGASVAQALQPLAEKLDTIVPHQNGNHAPAQPWDGEAV